MCLSVQMWMPNHAVFMKMSPMQQGLRALDCDSLEYTQFSQDIAPLRSHQTQNHIQSKSNNILSIVRRAEKQGDYLNFFFFFFFLLKSLRVLRGKLLLLVSAVRKIKPPFFICWEIRLNPTEPKTPKLFP